MIKRLYLDRKLILLNMSKYINIYYTIWAIHVFLFYFVWILDRNPFVDKHFMNICVPLPFMRHLRVGTQKLTAIYCLVLFSIGDYKLWSLIIREPLKISFSILEYLQLCECKFVKRMTWPWDDYDLIIWPWDFSAVQYGCTSE